MQQVSVISRATQSPCYSSLSSSDQKGEGVPAGGEYSSGAGSGGSIGGREQRLQTSLPSSALRYTSFGFNCTFNISGCERMPVVWV